MHKLFYQIIRGVSSVAEVKGKVRLYYERFPLFREEKKRKTNKEEKQHKSVFKLL